MNVAFRCLLVGVLLCLLQPLRAQLLKQDTARWSYTIASTFSFSKGNVDRLLFRSLAQVKHIHPKWGFASNNRHIYGTFGTVQTENDLISRNFIYLFPKRKIYPYVMTWLESNYRRQLNFRYQVGPGVTFSVLQLEKHLLKLSVTGTYERSEYRVATFTELGNTGSVFVSVWRATGRIYGVHSFFKDHLRLNYEFWWQQSLTDVSNYRYHAILNVDVPIYRGLAVEATFDQYYERVVPVGSRQGDTYFTIGITYKGEK